MYSELFRPHSRSLSLDRFGVTNSNGESSFLQSRQDEQFMHVINKFTVDYTHVTVVLVLSTQRSRGPMFLESLTLSAALCRLRLAHQCRAGRRLPVAGHPGLDLAYLPSGRRVVLPLLRRSGGGSAAARRRRGGGAAAARRRRGVGAGVPRRRRYGIFSGKGRQHTSLNTTARATKELEIEAPAGRSEKSRKLMSRTGSWVSPGK